MSLAFNDLLRSRLPVTFAAAHPGYCLTLREDTHRLFFHIGQSASGTTIGTFSFRFEKGKWIGYVTNGTHAWYPAIRHNRGTVPQSTEASGKADYEMRTAQPFMTLAEYTRIESQIMRRLLSSAIMFDAQFVHSICCQLQRREDAKYAALHEWATSLGFTRAASNVNTYSRISAENYTVTIDFHPANWRGWKSDTAPTAQPDANLFINGRVRASGSHEGVSWHMNDYGDRFSCSAFDVHDSLIFGNDVVFTALMITAHTVITGMSNAVHHPTSPE